jgi:hypothetical protein
MKGDASRSSGNDRLRSYDLDVQRIVLEPSPMELGLYREQYDALVADLKSQGYEVEIVRPVEYRSVFPDPQTLYNLIVHVGPVAGAVVNTVALVALFLKHLRGNSDKRPARRGCIDLPHGEKHEWDFPEE